MTQYFSLVYSTSSFFNSSLPSQTLNHANIMDILSVTEDDVLRSIYWLKSRSKFTSGHFRFAFIYIYPLIKISISVHQREFVDRSSIVSNLTCFTQRSCRSRGVGRIWSLPILRKYSIALITLLSRRNCGFLGFSELSVNLFFFTL